MPSSSLQDRVVIVTGASRRIAIGAAIARRLVADGAAVLLHSWAPHDAEQAWGADAGGPDALVDELRQAGGGVEHVSADLADPEAPAALVNAACDAFGHVDALVANHARSSMQSLEELTADELDLSYAVNTRATLLLARAFAAQHDDTRPGGRVLWMTSGQYHGAMPAELPYIASKAALNGLTRSLATHLMPRRITVNCVNPGPNDTGYADDHLRAEVIRLHPGGRWSTPADTARLIAWLLSDEADWVTGQIIASDGGWSARVRAIPHPGRAHQRGAVRRPTAGSGGGRSGPARRGSEGAAERTREGARLQRHRRRHAGQRPDSRRRRGAAARPGLPLRPDRRPVATT
jgi:3-oxoacyl-[acyl-carrier protein] reductase